MAPIIAVVRLLARLTKREVKSLSSLGLNNLFFCVVFLVAGGTAQQGFASTLLFQFVLLVPLFFALAADSLDRIPAVRESLWPLGAWERFALRLAGMAMNPAFWLLGGVAALWGGIAAGLCYFLVAVLVQVVVFAGASLRRGFSLRPMRFMPRAPGRLGGIVQLSARQILSTLDFYAALLLALLGAGYRWFAKAPEQEAFPILAMLVAIALSTVAQRMFGLETPGSMARYRLMPLAGWKLLLAKDAAYLAIAAVLVAPLGLRAGMACSFVALACGRSPSLRQRVAQKAWRFTGGDARFGITQVIAGGMAGLASTRLGGWVVVGAALLWVGSLYQGQRWWAEG